MSSRTYTGRNQNPPPKPQNSSNPSYYDYSDYGYYKRQSVGVSPLIVVIIGIAGLIVIIYVLRVILFYIQNLIMQGHNLQGISCVENQNDPSLHSERVPSFFKVVVLPDEDICCGIGTYNGQKQDTDTNAKRYALSKYLIKQEFANSTPNFDTKEPSNGSRSVRFFKTSSLSLNVDSESAFGESNSVANNSCLEIAKIDEAERGYSQEPNISSHRIIANSSQSTIDKVSNEDDKLQGAQNVSDEESQDALI